MTQNASGRANNPKLYSTVTSVGLPYSPDKPANLDLLKLKQDLRDLLSRHSEGISLSKARSFCPLLLNPQLLNDHASVRQLLQSMPDVVTLQGFGVQTILLPTIKTVQ